MSDERDWRGRRSIHGRDHLSSTDGTAPRPPRRAAGDPGGRPNLNPTGPVPIGNRGPHPAPVGAGDGGEPVDLGRVQSDDGFLDALARDIPITTRDDAEYELAELLSGWRHEVVTTPPPPLPSVEDVEHAIAATERTSRGRRLARHLKVVSGAAAVVIVAAAGLTVLSEGSQPGDPLWNVKKVVFSQAASETQAAFDVRSNLEGAEEAIAAGDTEKAAGLIAKAESRMGPVRNSETRDQMNAWINRLRAGTGAENPQQQPTAQNPPMAPTTDQTTVDPRSQMRTRAPESESRSSDARTRPETSKPEDRSSEPSKPSSSKPPTPSEPSTTTTTPTLSSSTPADLGTSPWSSVPRR